MSAKGVPVHVIGGAGLGPPDADPQSPDGAAGQPDADAESCDPPAALFADGFDPGTYTSVAYAYNDGAQISHTGIDSDGMLYIYNTRGGDTVATTGVLDTERWYRIEMRTLTSSSNGQLELWLDGQAVASRSGLDTGGAAINRIVVGIYHEQGPAAALLIDDVAADTAPIGP